MKKRGPRFIEDKRRIDWSLIDTAPLPMGTPTRKRRGKPTPWEALGVCRETYNRLREVKKRMIAKKRQSAHATPSRNREGV